MNSKLTTIVIAGLFTTACQSVPDRQASQNNQTKSKPAHCVDYQSKSDCLEFTKSLYTNLSSTISQKLLPSDFEQINHMAGLSLRTGEVQYWANNATGSNGSVLAIDSGSLNINIDTSSVDIVKGLKSVDASYKVRPAIANVRKGPSTADDIIMKLKQSESVIVEAQVYDSEWYLTSVNGIVVGYMHEITIVPDEQGSQKGISDNEVKPGNLTHISSCQTIENTIKLASGEEDQVSNLICKNNSGWSFF
ncbi:MAG: SH3 domain-containing protein [Pseudomonadales bacterium]|nr:SH3 domain-containing protein [Pseudomonadales bacterium]